MKTNFEIAKIAHETIRKFCIKNAITVQPTWSKLSIVLKASVVSDVNYIITRKGSFCGECYRDYKGTIGYKLTRLFKEAVKNEN